MNNDIFIEQLLFRVGAYKADTHQIDMLADDLKTALIEWVMSNLVHKLSLKDNAELTDLISNEADEEKVNLFLAERIPDYKNYMRNLYMQFANMYEEEYVQ